MLSGSTRFPFRSQITAAALAIAGCAALVAIGCSTSTPTGTASDSPASGLNDDRSGGSAPPLAPEDAGPAKAAVYRGNPLCNVLAGECMPDDDGSRLTSGAMPCAEDSDAGAGDAGSGTAIASMGCRIHREAADAFAPRCLSTNADTAGGDGAACKQGADCAAGFDCVVGENGTTQCRHYCCAGTCKGHESQSGGATFCDVQDLVDVNQKVPVCMPLKHCKLLGTGECNANESCAVVTESGDTGCVAVGEKQVGASCDVDHCAAGLTCLGTAGSRQCFKLCRVSSSECGTSQICATSTVFKDPNFGICQKP
ncbi:MAG: hypothetical protein JWO86_493 [Myxococcaceae bacterium]|nr:hypothetical protein [Myxococcaceae bacterium]MEA2750613.1 hypothetical protein [Myxococcales bacterium]